MKKTPPIPVTRLSSLSLMPLLSSLTGESAFSRSPRAGVKKRRLLLLSLSHTLSWPLVPPSAIMKAIDVREPERNPGEGPRRPRKVKAALRPRSRRFASTLECRALQRLVDSSAGVLP